MPTTEELQQGWRERVRGAVIEPTLSLTEAGLVPGAGTVLAAPGHDRWGRPALAIDGNKERILALLAMAYRRAFGPEIIGHIRRASDAYARGEASLAPIHLSRGRLPRLDDPKAAAWRLFVGEALLAEGLPPRDLLKICDLDPAVLDGLAKDYNPDEPRIPAGNGIESGEWSTDLSPGATANGNPVRDYGPAITPVADRQTSDEYRTGDPDKFFDTLYGPVHALAHRLGIDETWLFGLAVHESGWLDKQDRDRNDPFGVTHGGGPNVRYPSIAAAVSYWERRYGPIVRGATSARDFVNKLFAAHYNTADPMWRTNVLGAIKSIRRHLSIWRSHRGEI